MNEELHTSNNLDIEKALKDFEKISINEQKDKSVGGRIKTQKEVSGITFETESYAGLEPYQKVSTSKIVKFLIKNSGGLIKKEQHAEYLLLCIILVMVVLSIYLFLFTIRGSSHTLSPLELEKLKSIGTKSNEKN